MMYLPAQPKMQATPTHKRPFRETFASGPRFGGRFFFGAHLRVAACAGAWVV